MPITYSHSTRHAGWRQEMNTALKPSSGNDFLDGFLHRQTKRDEFVQHPTKDLKSNSTFERRSHLDKSKDSKSLSGNDFLDGFSQRQKTRDEFVQHQSKPSLKSSPSPGRNYNERGHHQDDSNDNKSFSENGFLNGFLQNSKPETDPCGASKCKFYEQELLANANNPKIQSPDAHSTKSSVALVHTKPKNEYVELKTEFSESSGGASRGLDGRGRFSPTDFNSSSQYTRKLPASTIKTPSPSTQYLGTRTSSTTSFNPPNKPRRELDENELRSSTDHSHPAKYTREPFTALIRTPSASTQYISTTTSTKPSNSGFHGCPKLSEAEWRSIAKKSDLEQQEFLESYLRAGKFEDVPVSSCLQNVKRADHLFYPGASGLYDHHLLCTKVEGDYIDTIEWDGSFDTSAFLQSSAFSNAFAFAKIQRGRITYKELENKKAKIREWPEELRRFSDDEIISRAESMLAKNRRDYHFLKNNCEHFVTWCICGLSTSLQVKPFYKLAWENVKGAGVAALGGVPIFLKAVANVSDDVLGILSSSLAPLGFALGGVIESCYAAWNINQDYKKMKEGELSREQFKINSVATASKAVGRIAGGIAGSIIGSPLGPFGTLLGGVVGLGVGHAIGSAVSWSYEYAPAIKNAFQDYVVNPVKEVVNTCWNAAKSAGRTVWEGVKSIFSSLFSW